MNTIIALCLFAVAVSALPRSEDQLILRLDEKIVSDGAATQDIINHLKYKYGYELIKEQPVGKLRFLGLRGNARYMSAIEALVGVKYIQLDNPRQIIQVCEEQPSPGTWGLDRIDQVEALPYTDPVSQDATYIYGGEATGSDSVVYIVDTGIDFVNPEFDGRASWGYTAEGMSDEDRHGHGTHCAGTVGAVNYGVAKDVTLVAVKVVNAFGAGTSLDFAGGIEWLISDHQAREASSGVVPKSVASMSLAYGTDEVVDNAAQEGADAGVIMVAAAGNNDHDACIESPSRVADVISVGASDVTDTSASFSNYGECVNLYAPGVDVLSTILNGETSAWSGTSMACPHVAGVVARFQSSLDVAPTTAEVVAYLESEATVGALNWFKDSHSASPNRLLYADC